MCDTVYMDFESDCDTSKVIIHATGSTIVLGEGTNRKKAAKNARKVLMECLAEVQQELWEIKNGL